MTMRRFILFILAALVLSGCASKAPIQNSTTTNISQINQTNATSCSGPVCGTDGKTYDCDAANVSIAHEGACVPAVCTENPGSITIGNMTLADSCLDADSIIRYVCVNGTEANITVPCGNGSVCDGGKCIEQNKPVNVTPPPGCSGPSAPDMHAYGVVTYNGSNYSDVCVEYSVVKDYFCKDGKMASENNECDPGYGCTNGVCQKEVPICSSTVAENDTTAQGKTTVVKGITLIYDQTDKCVDEGTLTKNYCLPDGTATSEQVPCGNGFKCFEGKCVQSQCNDTDGGINIYEQGTATSGNSSYTDYCSDDYTMVEYYCYGDEVKNEYVSCGEGYFCDSQGNFCMNGSLPG